MPMVKIPDGKGGFKEVEGTEFKPTTTPDKKKQSAMIQNGAIKDREERIANAAEACINIMTAYGSENDLAFDELGAALYLAVLNYRGFYPVEMGGVAAFDSMCLETAQYFDQNR